MAAQHPSGRVCFLLVQGQRVPCDADAVLHHFNTVAGFLDNEDDDAADGMQFPMPEWVTCDLLQRIIDYPGLHVPTSTAHAGLDTLGSGPTANTPSTEEEAGQAAAGQHAEQLQTSAKDAQQRIIYLTQHWRHLPDIAKAAEYLGYGELLSLATAAALLPLRPIIARHAGQSTLPSIAQVQAAKLNTAPEEALRLLLQPSKFDKEYLEAVVAIAPNSFWPLVDKIVAASVVPSAGVVPGLSLARVWPLMSTARRSGDSTPTSVSGIYGDGQHQKYLEIKLPLALLEAYEPRGIVVKIRSHDQGWGGDPDHRGTYAGSWTFGTLEVAGKEHPERVYTNLTATSRWTQHERYLGPRSEHVQALQAAVAAARAPASTAVAAADSSVSTAAETGGSGGQAQLQPGNTSWVDQAAAGSDVGGHEAEACVQVALWIHAYYPGWCNYVSEASLDVYLLPKHDPGDKLAGSETEEQELGADEIEGRGTPEQQSQQPWGQLPNCIVA